MRLADALEVCATPLSNHQLVGITPKEGADSPAGAANAEDQNLKGAKHGGPAVAATTAPRQQRRHPFIAVRNLIAHLTALHAALPPRTAILARASRRKRPLIVLDGHHPAGPTFSLEQNFQNLHVAHLRYKNSLLSAHRRSPMGFNRFPVTVTVVADWRAKTNMDTEY
ncbi:hypothetical protein BJY52DRAFT_1230666 [Lactarius psammicola]|nr:hypothetical protein BJY52DRAFT_1230666 [Lactarius psammicola]